MEERYQYDFSIEEHKKFINKEYNYINIKNKNHQEKNKCFFPIIFDKPNIIIHDDENDEYLDCSSKALFKIIEQLNNHVEKFKYHFQYLNFKKINIFCFYYLINKSHFRYYLIIKSSNEYIVTSLTFYTYKHIECDILNSYSQLIEYLKYRDYSNFLLVTRKKLSNQERKMILFKQIHEELDEGCKKMIEKSYAPPNGYNYRQLLLKYKK